MHPPAVAPPRPLAQRLSLETAPAPREPVLLQGRRAESYVRGLLRLLEAARFNRSFPDPAPVTAVYGFLGPRRNHYVLDGVEVDPRSGLPTEAAVTRVQLDAAAAQTVVDRSEFVNPDYPRLAKGASRPGDPRSLRAYRYAKSLLEAPIPGAYALELGLRGVDPEQDTAYFVTRVDRLDRASGVFARYTIRYSHRDERWTRPRLRLLGEDLEHAEEVAQGVACASLRDAEIAFLLVSELEGVRVESVTRGCIGPLIGEAADPPPALAPVLEKHPDSLALALAHERAALEVFEDRDGDPISPRDRDVLSEELVAQLDRGRADLGFGVARTCKLVCSALCSEALQAGLSEIGSPCVVHPHD